MTTPAMRRHEIARALRMAPILGPVVLGVITGAAYLSGLPRWWGNLIAVPLLLALAAPVAIGVEIFAFPRLARRLPHLSPVALMVCIRVVGGSVVFIPAVWIAGRFLVPAGVWWSWFPVVGPPVALSLGAVAASILAIYDRVYYQLEASFRELQRRRELERFLPREAVERILAGDILDLAGERKTVTVLFADLRNSTALAEKLPASEVVTLLNLYVGAMAYAVFETGGMIDKYLGDGLMAVFGMISDPSDGAVAATRAALAIRRRIEALNEERVAAGLPKIHFGVGIHTGEVVLGAVGIASRSDYTAIGDAVNTASRLQGMSKSFADRGVDAVISEATVRRLPKGEYAVESLGVVEIRGRVEPVSVYRVD